MRSRLIAPIVGGLALAGLLAALSTAVISGFSGGAQAPEVIHRTARPATATRTPTLSPTPTITLTPSETPTPTMTPTPFPGKDADEVGNTVMIGGSTGDETLDPTGVIYMPLFDGGAFATFGEAAHVVLPGAISHLTVRLGNGEFLSDETPYTFTLWVNGNPAFDLSCEIPSKGKGEFCEDGDKPFYNCLNVGPQDVIAVHVAPGFKTHESGESAGGGPTLSPHASWVAKLDLYGECPE